jgi:hypothetical protein
MGRGLLKGLVGGAIGLGQEAYAHHKESKARANAQASSSQQPSQSSSPQPPYNPNSNPSQPYYHVEGSASSSQPSDMPPPYTEGPHDMSTHDSKSDHDEVPRDLPADTEEANWALDEASVHPTQFGSEAGGDVDKMLASFMKRHPEFDPTVSPAPPAYELPGLYAPVILPQRRPENRDRGFVRAYAPDLAASGISQAAWLDFLDGFHGVIKYHPAFHAVNIAVMVGELGSTAAMGPSIIGQVVGMAVHTGVEAGRGAFIRYKTNQYIDGMNEAMFKPRGLYAMLMVYEPKSDHVLQQVDPTQNINQAVGKRIAGKGGKFSSSSGKTIEDEIPEVAPLIYPGLDELPEGEKKGRMKRTGAFLADYFDRRAQAEFVRSLSPADSSHPDVGLSLT